MKSLLERKKLDWRRLETAHFQFNLLQIAVWYPEHIDINKLSLHLSLDAMLIGVIEVYHGAFMKKYASEFML